MKRTNGGPADPERALLADEPVHLPKAGEFRPEPGEEFQVLRGYQYDDDLFRVIEYAPITSAPELVQRAYNLPELPAEAVHARMLERHDHEWIGTSMHTFPTAIMAPVGSTARAYSALHGGKVKPRAPKQVGSGRCEHCGEPTRGGRFLPGHDAKLKGDLIREGTTEACAERVLRSWGTIEDWKGGPINRAHVAKLIKQGDGFLRSRVAARIGADPGKQD